MSNPIFNAAELAALAQAAAAAGLDQTKVVVGGAGGDFEPPAAGFTRLRFVTYVEIGLQKKTFKGVPTKKNTVILGFELSGPKHPPIKVEGQPDRGHYIEFDVTLSQDSRATWLKLFNRLNYAGKATHAVQCLGDAYVGTVYHRKYAKNGEDKGDATKWTGVAVELSDKGEGISIKPPRVPDPETGEDRVLTVNPPTLPIRAFIWAIANQAQWNSIFIEGEYPERKDKDGKVTAPARSKNKYQELIKKAENFQGSPIFNVLVAGGQSVDVPTSTQDFDDVPDLDEVPDTKATGTPPWSPDSGQPDPLAGAGV